MGNPAVKNLGKCRVGWGCQQVHVVGVRSLLVGSLAEGKQCWRGGHRAGGMAWEGRTEEGLTGHEQVGLVPLLLVVMQCPQVDHNVCALVNGKVANAAPERERKRGSGVLSFPTCSAPRLRGPYPGEKSPWLPHAHSRIFSSASARMNMNPALYSRLALRINTVGLLGSWVCILSWCV